MIKRIKRGIFSLTLILIIVGAFLVGLTKSISAQNIVPATGGVGFTIQETFPDSNMAQAVANKVSGGNVTAVLTQGMIDSQTSFDFDYKDISDITGVEYFTNLTWLTLSGNSITHLPSNFENLSKLENLVLSFNKLTTLPDSFYELNSIKRLDLTRNINISIADKIENLITLERLHIGQCGLTKLPSSISNLTNLEYLDIDNNNISSLPDSIGNLSNLVSFKMYKNTISNLPESIGNLKKLEVLWVQNNQLVIFPNSVSELKNLKELSANGNKLTKLPNNFGNLSSLGMLFLNDNQLSYLPDDFGSLVKLGILEVRNNQLTSLPASFINLVFFKVDGAYLILENNLLPSGYADKLNKLGFPKQVVYENQRQLELKSNLNPVTIKNKNQLTQLVLEDFVILNNKSVVSPSHQFHLENYHDENMQPVDINSFIQNGKVIKPEKVFAKVRAIGSGLFPNDSDHAITSQSIELNFEVTYYKLSFDLNGATGVVPTAHSLIEGATANTVTQPTRQGFTFIEWNTTRDGTGTTWNFETTKMPAKDVTLYAQWKDNTTTGPINPKLPETGDSGNAIVFSGLLLIVGSTLLAFNNRIRKQNDIYPGKIEK